MSKLDTADVGSTLRDMWETRPARPRRDRKVAGVAAAIARRYDIDPVLVRVGFAVAAVYGIGIAFYVAGWLLLPSAEEDDPLDGAGTRSAGHSIGPAAWIAACVVLVATGGIFWGDNGGFVLPVLAVLVLLFLLHRSRGSRGLPQTDPATGAVGGSAGRTGSGSAASAAGGGSAGSAVGGSAGSAAGGASAASAAGGASAASAAGGASAASAAGGASAASAAGGVSAASAKDAADTAVPVDPDAPTAHLGVGAPEVHADPLDRGTPPGWDPLGAAPFAWDLPEPAQPEPAPEPVRRRSRLTPITLALALLGGGVAGVLVMLTSGLMGLPIVFATALTIVGFGLVVGSFARTGRGLIPFALILALLTWGAVETRGILPTLGRDVGDISVAPTDPAALAPRYDRGAGTITLDLSRLDTTVPAGTDATPIRTAASVGLGEIVVTVPPDADLTVRAHADLGDVSYGTTDQGGTDAQLSVVDDLGADGVRSGRPIELDLQAGLGQVEVRRG
ncbi:PspC domain-containing protein [Pseudonocardia oroxyli]|uniref:Phage shock protein C (PspC) family protein n=1 Tax=Pseudonocardia oroxyli TaxID=366584 RepID=A0A1G7GRI7_PSEOR|nr:PspC domain-containing protein [Pseudonocardia oroxyli]SDE90579.1 phage shock protein C (PspC) family protein [Pseudonocardia oroxyli]